MLGFLPAKQAPSRRNSKNPSADDAPMVSHVQVDGPSPGKGLLKDEACLLEPFRVRTGSSPEQDRVPGPVQKTDFAQDFPAEGKAPLPNQPGR